jgi:26S proteasome regulatory subunit N4
MLLAQTYPQRPQYPSSFYHNHNHHQQQQQQQHRPQHWESAATQASASTTASAAQSFYDSTGLVDYTASPNFSNLQIDVPTPFGSSQTAELMQPRPPVAPNSWNFTTTVSNGQSTPKSARGQHHRESSLSSLGSAGPASPYTHAASHPQIILQSDSLDTYYDGLPPTEQTSYSQFPKTLAASHDSFLNANSYGYNHYTPTSNIAAYMAMQKHHSVDDEAMPAPEYSHSGRPSVASTHQSPATPSASEDFEEQRKNGESEFYPQQWLSDYSLFTDYRPSNTIPKLDRTMSDVYNDELYSPNLHYTTSAPTSRPADAATMLSPSHSDVFSQRLQAANSQHLSAPAQSPLMDTSRGRSPFRQGSPLAPTATDSFGSQPPQVRLGSAAQMRERQKALRDAQILRQQYEKMSPAETPKTISPKDAVLEYHESAEDFPLFPQQKSSQYVIQNNLPLESSHSDIDDGASQQSFGSMATSRRESSSAYSNSSHTTQQGSGFTFAPPAVPGGVQVPQQYPFVPQQRRQAGNVSGSTDRSHGFPSTLTSMESTGSDYVPESSSLIHTKPSGSAADGGTYTCTYHGCTLRFETPAKLQKHKREGHRQSMGAAAPQTSVAGSPDGGSGMTSAALLRNSQAGPHKCERINPSTGKPCNTIFSRPYDLTRHEDTIHNARKQKVRCQYCTEEKTFSRNDALTRHMRVVHPEIDFAGKIRRRGHD